MAEAADLPVLLVAPFGCDAELIGDVLRQINIPSQPFADFAAASRALRSRLHSQSEDVGALLITEEALASGAAALLVSILAGQPAWSDLPVLILTAGWKGKLRPKRGRLFPRAMLLDRPVHVATLVSSVQAALRARLRQYERRLAEDALRKAEKLAVVGRLTSSIAHEINNPLESVTNLLYLLANGPLSQEQRQYVDLAREELACASEIAAHTLTFNRQKDIKGQAPVSELLDSVLALYQGRLTHSRISVERRYQMTPPITCYPGELRQVFANLIGNAFDASRGGGRILLREREVTNPATSQRGVRITVADTGQGVGADMRKHLFEAFNSSKGMNGTGLGLWISKGIVEKHHGSIRVHSSTRLGCSGTVLAIFIPTDEEIPGNLEAAS